MRTAIFDLDGTLADTSADLIDAANACFAADGLPAPLDHEKHAFFAFAGGRAMLLKGSELLDLDWGEDEVAGHYPRLLAHYETHIDRHTQLYDGAIEALEGLADLGWRLGVCTNKPEALAEKLLQRLGIRGRFGSMIGAGSLPVRKPHPEPLWAAVERSGGRRDAAVLIGDTITDADTGRAADIPSVLVTFGPEGEDVVRHRPTATIGHFRELIPTLEQLVPG